MGTPRDGWQDTHAAVEQRAAALAAGGSDELGDLTRGGAMAWVNAPGGDEQAHRLAVEAREHGIIIVD